MNPHSTVLTNISGILTSNKPLSVAEMEQ